MGGKSGFTYIYIYRTVCHGCCGVGSGTTYIRHTTDECNLRSDNVTMSFVSGMVGGRVGLLGSHPFLRTQIRTLILQHSSSDRPSIPTLPRLTLPTTLPSHRIPINRPFVLRMGLYVKCCKFIVNPYRTNV